MTFLPARVVGDPEAQLNFEALSQMLTQSLSSVILQSGSVAGGDLAGAYPNPTLAAATLQKFLQLKTAGMVHVVFGTTTISTVAGQAFSATNTVTHGLGTTPGYVFATANSNNGTAVAPSHVFNIGAATFDIQGQLIGATAPVGGLTSLYAWMAIG